MTLVISKGITLRKGWQPMDADAAAYITAVETADTEPLEEKTKIAIDNFVLGCKADGIWNAIKASCILAGARTLEGALVPLMGAAPTNVGGLFVSGDYNRKTGLVGNGSTKYLDSNRSATADPQNNHHLAVYKSSGSSAGAYIGNLLNAHNYLDYASGFRFTSRNTIATATNAAGTAGFLALSRSGAAVFEYIISGVRRSATGTSSSLTQDSSYYVFNRRGGNYFTSDRLAFYSIGESLDLALLDDRVTDLINAFAAAIP